MTKKKGKNMPNKKPTKKPNKPSSKPTPKNVPKIPPMGDKEMMSDCLNSEKNCTSVYNTFANECVNPRLRNDFINTLKDAHDVQSELFMEAKNRGWYVVKDAKATDIQQAAKKYSASGMSS